MPAVFLTVICNLHILFYFAFVINSNFPFFHVIVEMLKVDTEHLSAENESGELFKQFKDCVFL